MRKESEISSHKPKKTWKDLDEIANRVWDKFKDPNYYLEVDSKKESIPSTLGRTFALMSTSGMRHSDADRQVGGFLPLSTIRKSLYKKDETNTINSK